MIQPRKTYRPRTNEGIGTKSFSLTTRVLDYITDTARRENLSQSYVVNRALERDMAELTEESPTYDERETA